MLPVFPGNFIYKDRGGPHLAHRLWFAHPRSRGKVSQVREEPGSSPEGGICWLPGWGAPPYTVHRPGGPEESVNRGCLCSEESIPVQLPSRESKLSFAQELRAIYMC